MKTILRLTNIEKRYPGVTALDDVSIEFKEGEIHSIMGENGAGKSTLIKVISGAISPDHGKIEIDGKTFESMTPASARKNGIGVIYQEFNLIPSMSVVENIFLGERVGSKIMPDFEEMHRRASEIFKEFGVDIDTAEMVANLSTAKQQLVEIAKALSQNVKIMIMDEPSASISVSDVETLFRIIRKLKEKKVTVIYISHRMDEVFELSDRVTVMRDGKHIATKDISEVVRKDLITMMVGRELNESYPVRNIKIGEKVLEVKNLSGNGNFDISFDLRKGEILGIAGLVGAGRTELAKVLYGAAKMEGGSINIKNKRVNIKTPRDAISYGLGYIPEDRKREGAFLDFPIDWNIVIMSLKRLSKMMVVSNTKSDEISDHFVKKLNIKTPHIKQYVRNLSGGNQQKVVLAKTLASETDIIIFDEPTRGIDVGAKHEIYELMNELVGQGISIIMISSEMEELMGMSDRILVMHEGKLCGELQKKEFMQNKILELASGL
jgi:monosaccharide ABC transporter ATP-binding protein, CUT2 family (TC 3.A.1.2.-)